VIKIKSKKYLFYIIFTTFFIIVLSIITVIQNNYKENYKKQFLFEKDHIEFFLNMVKNDLFNISSDLISSTISNVLDRQLESMDIAEISALKNNLLVSDNIKSYVEFHDRYKIYLNQIYFKDYLNNFYIYNKSYDRLSPYNLTPIENDLANKTIFNLSQDLDFSTSKIFEYKSENYFYIAMKNRELKAGFFTGKSLGYILYEVNLNKINTSLNIINKSDFLNIDFLPANTNEIKSFYNKSSLSYFYFSTPIEFLDSNIFVYKKYSKTIFNYAYLITTLFYIFGIIIIYYSKYNYKSSLIQNIPSLKDLNDYHYKKDPEKLINQIIIQKIFEIEFLRNTKEENRIEQFKQLYEKYFYDLDLPNYIAFYTLENISFVFSDKIDMNNNHLKILENLEIYSECIKEIRTSHFDNSLSSLIEYIKNDKKEILKMLKGYYINLFSINDEQIIAIIKDSSKNKIENFKNILKNL
jgi:hypothetical protein